MFFGIKDFVSFDACDELIEFYTDHQEDAFEYGLTRPLDLYNDKGKIYDNDLINNFLDYVTLICSKFENNLKLDKAQIVKWEVGSDMKEHSDPPPDVFAALIYLNDDYDGGQTVIDDMIVPPHKGDLLVFSNGQINHHVKKVSNKERYTFAFWYAWI